MVDSSPEDDETARISAGHPLVRYHHHDARLGAHEARNFGASLASGDVLAFIDPDMTASPQWLEKLLRAEASGRTVVCGGVGCPEDYWSRAVHFTKYGWWLDSGEPSERSQVPSGNLCLRSALFATEGGFPARYWEGDTEFSYRLRAKGHQLWYVPAAATVHYDRPSWYAFLAERWERGMDTARARSTREEWTRLELAGRTVAAPITWFAMMFRCARYAAKAGKLASWCSASPVIGIGLAMWVVGECRIYAERLWE